MPAIAADAWGVTVHEVLKRIMAGSAVTKIEGGFVLVDAAPAGAAATPVEPAILAPADVVPAPTTSPARRRPRPRRRVPTYTAVSAAPAPRTADVVSDAELDALRGNGAASAPNAPAAVAEADAPRPVNAAGADDEEMGPAGDPDPDAEPHEAETGPPVHWQQVRSRVSRMRKPPGAR